MGGIWPDGGANLAAGGPATDTQQLSSAQKELLKANVHSLARNTTPLAESPDTASRATPHYKITPRAAAKLTPRGYGRAALSLFDSSEASAAIEPQVFGPRSEVKRLDIDPQVVNRPAPQFSAAPAVTSPVSKVLDLTEAAPESVQASQQQLQQQQLRNLKSLPVIDQPDYYVKPDLAELATMTDDQLAQVPFFEVGRRGYGKAKFLGVVDVRGVRINDIFIFRHKSLAVYPDESQKPPVGEGFNRPAMITLEHVFPQKRGTKERITNPHAIAKYEQKLRDRATFVSYNSHTGEWVFTVPHFGDKQQNQSLNEDDSALPPLAPMSPKSPIVGDAPAAPTLDTPATGARVAGSFSSPTAFATPRTE
jgi:hypothetical protein